MKERSVTKTKKLTCGHEQKFSTPVPEPRMWVWCTTCDKSVQVVWKPHLTVGTGRPRRLKTNPRSNNQHTKGRQLAKG